MDQVKVGVIGVGRMGQRHSRVYSNMRKVQLIGVYDNNPEVAKRVADQYDIISFNSPEELIAQVDAVTLATPTQSHADLAQLCVSNGIHILIEKPITETLDQAEGLVKTVEESKVIVQVGHIERFNPAYIELKNVLEDTPKLAVTFNRLSPYLGSNTDVDVVLDLMIHDTNLVLDLLGRSPIKITSSGMSTYSGTIDHGVAQLNFPGGPILSLTASRITEHKVRKINVTGHDAFYDCNLLDKTLSIYRSTRGEYLNANAKGVKYRQESIVEWINVPPFEPLFLQLQHFIDCICENTLPAVSARDGLHAMQLAMEIREQILRDMLNGDRRKTPRPSSQVIKA